MNKGPGEAHTYDATTLRIGILHSRWNAPVISALVSGARSQLLAAGVPEANIITQSVPGSYELPLAAQRMYAASTVSSGSSPSRLVGAAATDVPADDVAAGTASQEAFSTSTSGEDAAGSKKQGEAVPTTTTTMGPFDAIIAIGVLIKGSTMHFEYIADAVSHGLMKVQLDCGVPVVFGLLTCLTEEQAYTRAGLVHEQAKKRSEGEKVAYGEQGHNHGEDWGRAAVEMGVKGRGWGRGVFVQ